MDQWKATALVLGGVLFGTCVKDAAPAWAATSRYVVSGKETSKQGGLPLGFFLVQDSVTGKCYLVVHIHMGGGVTESPCDPPGAGQ